MEIRGFYPVLGSRDVEVARRFWTTWFGFRETFQADWYVSLRRDPGGQELALLDHTHPTIPEGFRHPARGVLVNLEVDDVDAEWDRLVVRGGLEPVLALRSEEFGQRHFILAAPDGVLVDVITEIPPGDGYAEAFSEAGASR